MIAGSLEIQLLAEVGRLSADLKRAEGEVHSFASRVGKHLDMVRTGFAALGGAAVVGGLVAGLVQLARGAVDAADELGKLSQRTGMSVESLSQMRYAAKLADVSNESLTTGIKKLNVSIAEGLAGDKQKVAMFKQLGVTTEDLGKGTEHVMLKMADGYATAKDGAGKTAVSLGLMGKAGDEMIPFLNGGAQALRDLMKEADKLGITISSDFAERSEQFNDNLTRIRTGSEKLAIVLGENLVKSLGMAIQKMAEATVEGGKLAGIVAFIQGLWTGDDRHKANVAMAKGMEQILTLEQAIAKARERGDEATAQRREKLLEAARREYETHRNYARMLDEEEKKAKAAAEAAKKARTEGRELKVPTAGGGGGISEANKELERQARLFAELSGLSPSFQRDWDDLSAAYQRGAISLEQLLKYQAALLAKQPAVKANLDAEAKALAEKAKAEAEAATAYEKYIGTLADSVEKLDAEIRAEQEAAERIGLTKRAIAELDAQKLELLATGEELLSQRAIEENSDQREIDALRLKAKQYRDLAAAKRGRAEKEEAQEAGDEMIRQAQRAREEWERTSAQIADSFVDNLMRGGKSVAQYLKDLFRTLVLRPLLQPIGNAFAGAVNGMMGGAVESMGASAGSSMFGSAAGAGAGAMLGGATIGGVGTFGAGFTGASAMGFTGGLELAGALAGSGQFIGAAGAVLGAIPVVGWIALAAAVIASMASGGETRVGGQYSGANFIGGPDGGPINGAQDLLGPTLQSINSTLAALGASQTLTNFVSGLEQSENNRGFAYAGGSLSDGTVFGQGVDGQGFMNRRGSMTDKEALAAFVEELAQTKLEAIQASNAVGPLAEWVRSLGDVSLLAGKELMDAVTRLDKAVAEKATLEARLYDLTATDAEKLIAAREKERATIDVTNLALYDQVIAQEDLKRIAEERKPLEQELMQLLGNTVGLRQAELATLDPSNQALQERIWALQEEQALIDKLKSVRPFFMTEEEVKNMTATEIAGGFNSATGANITPEFVLGLSVQDYRDYFDAFVAEGNQAAVTAMIELAPAFQTLVQSMQDADNAAEALAKSIADEHDSLQMQYWQLIGDTQSIRDAVLESLDPSNRALQQLIWDTEDAIKEADKLKAARERVAQAAKAHRDAWENITDSMLDEVARLRGAIADSSPNGSLAYHQAQFYTALAQAGAGDQKAGQSIPGLSQAVEEAAMRSATSLAELNTIRAGLATSLEGFNAPDWNHAMVSELKELRREARESKEEVKGLRAEMRETNKKQEQHQKTTADILDDVYDKSNGALTTTPAA